MRYVYYTHIHVPSFSYYQLVGRFLCKPMPFASCQKNSASVADRAICRQNGEVEPGFLRGGWLGVFLSYSPYCWWFRNPAFTSWGKGSLTMFNPLSIGWTIHPTGGWEWDFWTINSSFWWCFPDSTMGFIRHGKTPPFWAYLLFLSTHWRVANPS